MLGKYLFKKKLKKIGYDWIPITSLALEDYRNQVKNNKYESKWTLERKLNRNFYVGVVDNDRSDDKFIHKKFGALTIIYRKDINMIIGITNHRHGWNGYEIDIDLKNKLNKIYGLD